MATAGSPTTVVSTKGQVILPKSIRDQLRWTAGTQLVVESTSEGVLLRAAPVFEPTRSADVFGILRRPGPPTTLQEMKAAVLAEAKRRHARGRY